jgi:hypothetical protein
MESGMEELCRMDRGMKERSALILTGEPPVTCDVPNLSNTDADPGNKSTFLIGEACEQ